jgi:hypothetical protein
MPAWFSGELIYMFFPSLQFKLQAGEKIVLGQAGRLHSLEKNC